MTTKKFHVYGVAFCCAVAMAACTKTDRTAENTTTRTDENKEQVLSERTTPMTQQEGTAVERGESELQARKETVTKEVESVKEKVPTVVSGREKLDVNRMDKEDFVALGLDEQTADRVITQRDQRGHFASIDDMSGIQGLNQDWLNRYRDRFAFTTEDQQKAGEAAND